MLLYFPSMHVQFASDEPPLRVRFLDPGLVEQADGRFVRPEGLPLDPRSARAFVEESLRFGEQFPTIKDLSYYAVGRHENCFDQTSMAIRSELRARIEGVSKASDSTTTAQSLLLLAYSLEQRILETDACLKGVQGGHAKLVTALGFSEEDLEDLREMGLRDAEDIHQEPAPLASAWRNVLEAMLMLTGCVEYYTDDPHVLADLEELGLLGSGCDSGGIEDPAWKILGLTKPDDKRPWLNAVISVFCPAKVLK